MLYLMGGFNLLILVLLASIIVGFWKILQWTQRSFHEERMVWSQERQNLLDRCMSKEWQTYAQVQGVLGAQNPLSLESLRGNDESELEKMGHDLNGVIGDGEPIVDLSDDYKRLFS